MTSSCVLKGCGYQMYSGCNRYRCYVESGGVESGGVAEERWSRRVDRGLGILVGIYKKEDGAVNHK
jgi:hypothetical protein